MNQPDIYQRLREIFGNQPSARVIECGAHVGHDTVNMLRLFRNPRVIAYEPDPRNLDILKQRGLHTLVQIVPAAVGAANGKATFNLSSGTPPWDPSAPPEAWAGSSSLKRPKGHTTIDPWCKFDRQIEVDVVTLDSSLAAMGVGHVDFLWADVQGAEGDMVLGGQAVFAHTRYLYCEYSNEEVFEGQVTLQGLLGLLPGKWEMVQDFKTDVLLKNVAYQGIKE